MKDLDTGEEIKINDKVRNKSKNKKLNKSNLLRVSSVEILIPNKIYSILNGIDDEYSSVEFSICVKTEFDYDRDCYVIDADDIFIPEQVVSAGGIDYKEDDLSYNTVIHKHPNNCHNFSQTDKEYINGNFKFSLLWCDRKFVNGLVNIQIEPGVFLETPLKMKCEPMARILPDHVKTKIIKYVPVKPDTVKINNMANIDEPFNMLRSFGFLNEKEDDSDSRFFPSYISKSWMDINRNLK